MLEVAKRFPQIASGRPELSGDGFCLGATFSRKAGRMTIHSHTTGYPKLVQEFISALRRVGAIPERFVFSSIQLNHNPVVRRHRDQNKDKSMIASFGHFTGGVLMAARLGSDETSDDAWEEIDIYERAVEFDGQRTHFVTEHKGDRYSVILFLNGRWNELQESELDTLRALGFKLPTKVLNTEFAPVKAEAVPGTIGREHEVVHATKKSQQLTCTNKTLVVQIGGGFFSIAFAVRMLEVDCEVAVISNDSEVISAAQRLPKPVTVLGAIGQDLLPYVQACMGRAQCDNLILMADLRKEAVARLVTIEGTQRLTRTTVLTACVDLAESARRSGINVMGTAYISDKLSEKNMGAFNSWLKCMPYSLAIRSFAPMQGEVWLWCTGDVKWPAGTEILQQSKVHPSFF